MKSVVAFLVLAAALPVMQAANPIEKVLEMLSSMQQKLIAEGADTQREYNERAEFCEESAKNFAFEIKTEKSQVAKLTATIESQTATATGLSSKIEDLSSDISSNGADLKTATGIRKKEASDFGAEESQLMEVADSLERAVSVLTKEMAKGGASMLQLKSAGSVTDTLRIMVQGAAISSEDGSKLTALMQERSQDEDADADSELGAPAAAVTENKSGGIVSTLEGLLEKTQEQLDKARKAEATSQQNFAMLKQSLSDEIKFGEKDMAEAKAALAASQEAKAVAAGDLEATSKDLQGDQKAKQELHHACMTSAQEFESAVKSRGAELQALAQAKKIIQQGTGGAASQSYDLAQTSFLQVAARAKVQSANSEAVRFVRNLAARHRSPALAQLASRMNSVLRLGSMNGADPFAKVRGLITDMLSQLEEAAEADATKKAYCDKEMSETTASKDDKTTVVESLTTKVAQKTAMSSKLKEEVSTLQKELGSMIKAQGELTQLRQEENATYKKNQPEMEQGLNAVKMALKVLREYYAQGSSLLQTSGSAGIIGLLEVVESDFSKGLAEMNVQEESAANEYESSTQAYDVEKVAKEKDQKYKTKEFKGLDKAVAELSADVTGGQEQLDAILEYYAKIKGECTAKPESYEVRKQRREDELAGLKQALTILEGESFLQGSSRRSLRVARHH